MPSFPPFPFLGRGDKGGMGEELTNLHLFYLLPDTFRIRVGNYCRTVEEVLYGHYEGHGENRAIIE
jgi:hypothetical protein